MNKIVFWAPIFVFFFKKSITRFSCLIDIPFCDKFENYPPMAELLKWVLYIKIITKFKILIVGEGVARLKIRWARGY